MTREWWCDACAATQPADGNWCALWHTSAGGIHLQPHVAPWLTDGGGVHSHRDEVYACGQGSALVLVERFLATGGFSRIEITPAAAFLVETF